MKLGEIQTAKEKLQKAEKLEKKYNDLLEIRKNLTTGRNGINLMVVDRENEMISKVILEKNYFDSDVIAATEIWIDACIDKIRKELGKIVL